MAYHGKAKKVWSEFKTRKDWYHETRGYLYSYYRKKPWRKVANRWVRRFKGEISNGGSYKKLWEIEWTVL